MKNARPTCPNEACSNHANPPTWFYRKKGYRRAKHNRQPVPRYQCKACGKYFCATQTKPIRQQHRSDLNQQVSKLAVSGMSMRRMVLVLGCSKLTISRKVTYLAGQARLHHARHLAELQAGHVMFDELESLAHARYLAKGIERCHSVSNHPIHLAFDILFLPRTGS